MVTVIAKENSSNKFIYIADLGVAFCFFFRFILYI